MSERNAPDLYNDLVRVIDRAAAEKNIYAVPAAAEAAAMTGGQTHKGLSERWSYSFTDTLGQTVELHCRWYDQSQAFSPAPDMHRMSVVLKTGGNELSHSGEYEE